MPFGVLDDERRPGLAGEATEPVPAAAGLGADQALRVWLLIHEQPDETWGAGGKIMRCTKVAGLATG